MSNETLYDQLMEGPALAPPPGQTSNLINPPGFTTAFSIFIIVMFIFPTCLMITRLYTKAVLNRKVELEDYIAILAWAVFTSIFIVARIDMASYPALGLHQWNVRISNLVKLLYYLRIESILYGISMLFIKISILLQYLRIFTSTSTQTPIFRYSCHTLMVLITIFYTIATFLEIFSCRPLDKSWNPFITTGSCPINVLHLNIVSGAFNTLSDLIILILPQPVIWKLRMTTPKKLGVSAIFAAGVLACVSSALRLYYSVLLSRTSDYSWNFSLMAIFAFPELGVGICISCLPSLPKFFRTHGLLPFLASFPSNLRKSSSEYFGSGNKDTLSRKSWRNSLKTGTKGGESYDVLKEEHLLTGRGEGAISQLPEDEITPSPWLGLGQMKVSRTVHISSCPSPTPGQRPESEELRPMVRIYTRDQRPWETHHYSANAYK